MILRPLCVLIFAMACTLLHAQSNITSPPAINSGGIGVSSSTPTGIQYRRIFFPADQAAKLVPATYWPMELSDLEQRLKQLQANQDGAPSTLEVVEHFVEFDVITNNLKCVSARVKRSTSGATDNATASTDLKPLYLGQANVAAEFQIPADLPNGNVVWSVPGQGLYAYLRHDDELEFSWTRNGIAQSNRAQLFDLKLPVALRSTMWLLLPEGFTAQVTGGVATDLGGLPSGILAPTNLKPDVAGKSRWWQIDFGGSANLQLLIRPAPDAAATLTTVVRRAQVKYEVDPNGISWVAQYTIDASDRQPLPAFGVSGTGRITDISIGAESLRWTESRQDDLVIAQPEPSPSLIQRTDSQRSEITLTVSGVDEANAGPELQLPWIRPVRSKVVAVDPQLELQVHTVAGQQLLRGDSSGPWRLNGRSTNGRALQWLGPHEVPPPSVRLEATEEALTGSAITGISIERGRIRAKWVALLDLPSPRPRLLKLRVASTWDVESVTSPHGTVTRPQNEGGRNYTLWIEPSEIDPKQPVRIQVSASKTLDDNLPEVQTRSGWIVQLDDSRLDEAAYLQAPADREVQLPTDGRRRQVTSLEALQLPAVLLAEIPPGALWFAGHGGCPGATLLQRATVFDAELLTKVSFDSIDGYRWESQVACTPRGGELSELKVRVYGSDATDLVWAMQVAEDQALIALSAEPELQDNFVDWNVRLGTPRNTSFTLLARRRMTGHPLNVPLPTVPGAANQRAEIRLDSGMLPIDLPSGFSQLPLPPKSTEESRLSYTADQVPSLIVERQTSRSSTLVCWSWQVEHALGNGRNVTVSINAKLTGNGLLRLPVPGTLKLLDGYLNDTRLSDDQMRLRDGTLVLDVAADQATHTLRLRFTSQELHTAALWHYTPTEILPQDLAVADQQTTVTPNADLWLLALRDAADRGSYWIVPAATGIVCGSAIACCCFVLGWLARRPKSQFIVHLIALSFGATAFFVQYPLQGWCIGWCIAVGVGRIASSFWNLSAPRLKTRGPSSVNLLGRRGSSPSQSLHANGPVIKAPMIGFLILTASWAWSQQSAGPIFEIMIPVDDDGELVGTKVYVPKSLYQQLSAAPQIDREIPMAQIVNSRYALSLIRSAESTGNVDLVKIDATWTLLVPPNGQEIFLPVAPETVQHLEFSEPGVDRRQWRTAPATGPAGLYLQPPRDGLLQVRATLIPTLQTTNDLANLSLSLPQVADTALQVLYDTVASPPEVMNYFGVVVNDTATRQVTAQLGPVKDLKVRWRLSLTPPVAPELRVEPRWWVHVGEQDISLEMEHDRPTNAGIARLIVDQSEPPICTNPAWQIQNAQIIEGGRRSIQLAPLSDSPGPIRLLWSLKARGTAQENIALPTVRAEDTPPPSRILLGIDAPPDWKVEPVGNAAEPLASDALALSWKGQPGAVTGVYRLDTSAAPTLSIVRSTPPERFYHERHRLHLSDAIEANLRYELRFTDEQAFEPLRFELPAQFSIDAVEVDGAPAFDSVVVQDTKRYLTLRLDPDLSAHRILIEGRAGRGNRFRPPKLRMIGLTAAESNYEVVYDPGVRVNRESPAVLEGLPLELTPEQQLSDLIVPLVRWQVPAKYLASTALPDWLQLERAVTNGADIVSVMRYNDGTWTNETQITLRGLNGNFVALEIPSDWSKGVRFEPTAPSVLLRPENGVRVVHVLPQIDSSGNAKFTLRSELATDVRRVEAPIIRIRGRGERNYHLVLPGRLTSKPQDWQRVAMRPSATSVQALGVKEPPPDPVILEPESIAKPFAAMPISDEQQGKDPASAALRESAYLRSPNHTSHVLTRWDLTPGDEREVIIDLPPHATCINVTSCGQNTNWSIVEPPADGSGRNDPQPRNATTAIRVPLNLSQLAQQFEVLISLDDQVPALPTLRDVPVERSVLRILSPLHLPSVPTQPSKVWEPVSSVAEIRHQAASSVLQASVDAIADRPRREIAAWLAPWLPRLIDANMRSTSSDTADDEQEGLPPEVANLLSNIDQQQISLDSANQQVSPTEDPRLWRVDQLLVADNQPVEVPEPEPFRSWSTTAPFRSTVFLWCAALLLVSFILGVLTYLLPELLRTSTTPLLLGGLLTTVLHPPTGCVLVAAAILITWYQRSTWLPQNGVQPSRP